MTTSLFTLAVVLSYIFHLTDACSLTANWEPWNITQRSLQADTVMMGTVIGYYPIYQSQANTSPLYYTAEVDVSCVFGVRADASVLARSIFDNNGVVDIIGFNPRMVRCPSSEVDILVNREYVFLVIGDGSGVDMRPHEINAQPAVANATTSIIAQFSEAMTSGPYTGYRMKSRKCSVASSVDVTDVEPTTTSKEGMGGGSKLTPKRVVGGGEGSGHRLQLCQLSLFISILLAILL